MSKVNNNLEEIIVKDYPVCIFSDSHCNIQNIKELQRLYPKALLISLGDFTFLFSKPGETFNHRSIDYFIKHKIPCLKGNHEEHILGCSIGDSFTKIMPKYSEDCSSSICDADIYDLTQQQIDFLRKLPIGFKLILPNGKNYLCFHNKPRDLWVFDRDIDIFKFKNLYPIDPNTLGVIKGHLHENILVDFPAINCKLVTVGQICNGDHHGKHNNGKNYCLLTENGIEYKKL